MAKIAEESSKDKSFTSTAAFAENAEGDRSAPSKEVHSTHNEVELRSEVHELSNSGSRDAYVASRDSDPSLTQGLLSPSVCPQCDEPLAHGFAEAQSPEDLRFCSKCQLPLLLVAGKYRLEKRLTEGGNGVVYLARHVYLRLSPMRVVKFLKPKWLSNPTATKRFLREIQLTAVVSQNNPHIVRVYDDFGEVPKLGLYYIMEYLEGRELSQVLHDKSLSQEQMLDVFLQLCEAIDAAHESGVVHRDIKPSNIFLVEQEHTPAFVKVMDFGIAKILDTDSPTITRGNEVPGTPVYMAPEQFMEKTIDHRTDVYCLGVLLYEMMVGHPPFVTPGQRLPSVLSLAHCHLHEDPEIPEELHYKSSVNKILRRVLQITLQKDPDQRFQSVHELSRALLPVLPPKTPLALGIRMQANEVVLAPSAKGSTEANIQPLVQTRETSPEVAQVKGPEELSFDHPDGVLGKETTEDAKQYNTYSPSSISPQELVEQGQRNRLFDTPSNQGLAIASVQTPNSTLELSSLSGRVEASKSPIIVEDDTTPLSLGIEATTEPTHSDMLSVDPEESIPAEVVEPPQTILEIAVVGNTSRGVRKGKVQQQDRTSGEEPVPSIGPATIPETDFITLIDTEKSKSSNSIVTPFTTIAFFVLGALVLSLVVWMIWQIQHF